MPELPEVETIKNDLAPRVVGRRIQRVKVLWPGSVRRPSVEEFQRRLVGTTIQALARRGKYLIFRLCGGTALIFHLKMTGALLLGDKAPVDPHTRAIFELDDPSKGRTRLLFSDIRKLGGMWLVEDEREVISELGPEPLDPAFTAQRLGHALARRPGPIKAVLCDQSLLAGVGNIYADEALFEARLHPLRPARSLSPQEVKTLHRAIRKVLRRAIECRGTTILNYRDPAGKPGSYQEMLGIPRRAGASCSRCGTPIARIPLRGRGTYFCPRCQPQ